MAGRRRESSDDSDGADADTDAAAIVASEPCSFVGTESGDPEDYTFYTPAADCWSIGATIYSMITSSSVLFLMGGAAYRSESTYREECQKQMRVLTGDNRFTYVHASSSIPSGGCSSGSKGSKGRPSTSAPVPAPAPSTYASAATTNISSNTTSSVSGSHSATVNSNESSSTSNSVIWEHCAFHLVFQLTDPNETTRLSIQEAICHPYLRSHGKGFTKERAEKDVRSMHKLN